MPWSTKRYSVNNSSAVRTTKKENALGIFPAQRRSLGLMNNSPTQDKNVKAGTFAFGGKV